MTRSRPSQTAMGEEAHAAAVAARLLATIARRVGASLALDETLDAVAEAVIEALGFRAAVVNLLGPDDDLHVVSVAGSDEIRTALYGTHAPRASWERLLDAAAPWGDLRFVDHRAEQPDGTEDMHFYVPPLPVPDSDEVEAWHPNDALFAPLVGADGELLGVLSVDDPEDGCRPNAVKAALLEAFAVQAALAIEHAREHAELRDSETLLRRLFDESPIGKALFGPDGRYQRVNRAYCEFLGRSPEDFLGRTVVEFAHPDEMAATERLSRQIRTEDQRVYRVEKRYLHADGTERWGRLSLTRIGEGDRMSVLAAIEDITDARAADEQLRHLALHDSLTGLPNRTLILDRLGLALARARREGTAVGVAVIDIDHFKLVNDSYGHPVGDQLLVDVARRLADALRESDTAGRLGGDEFVVVCELTGGVEEMSAIASRLRAAVRVPVDLEGVAVLASASVGCTIGDGDATPDRLMAEADAALYRAKAAGRGRFELFDEEMRRSSLEHLELRAQLQKALDRDEFRLHYQPILDQLTGETVGYEALLRWEHPDRGLLAPAAFLSVLADSELDVPVTRWVLHRACGDIARLAAGSDEPFISVNLSPRQLSRADLAADVDAALRNTGLPAHRLWLEITEEHLVANDHRSVLDSLRELGCHIVLDDFGTGYSGLTYLQQLPVDVLKIDRQFIARMGTDRVSAGITAAVADLAQLLHITVVAEGVETRDQASLVRNMGIDYVQGYYYGRPAPLPAGAPALAPPVERPA